MTPSPKQEPKYAVNAAGEVINRASGRAIPDFEPIFILLGSNPFAAITIRAYLQHAQNGLHAKAVDDRLSQFEAFATVHANSMQVQSSLDLAALSSVVDAEEPVMIFRAQDRHARIALEFMKEQLATAGETRAAAQADDKLELFEAFAENSPSSIKEPDTELPVPETEQQPAAGTTNAATQAAESTPAADAGGAQGSQSSFEQ